MIGRELSITVKRAVAFTVKEDGHSLSLRSTQPGLALALKENGILLGQGDLVVPDLATPLVSGLNAEVRHASKITVSLPEGSSVVYTHKKTVADALDDAGIEVSPLDKVLPGRDELVSNGMDVQVVRVTVGTIVEREEIGYQTLFKGDPDLGGAFVASTG
jgi:uncharacterized protein YabE (DUF348 family)